MKLFLGIFGFLETIFLLIWAGFIITRDSCLTILQRIKANSFFKGFIIFYTAVSALFAGILTGIIILIMYLSGNEL